MKEMVQKAKDGNGVYMVPAFTGLGAPYWDPHARGAFLGMTRDTGAAELVKAALEAVCFQTRDLLESMHADACASKSLRVDGGMVANEWLLQELAAQLSQLYFERSKAVVGSFVSQ